LFLLFYFHLLSLFCATNPDYVSELREWATVVTIESKDKLCLRIDIGEYSHTWGTLEIILNSFKKFQPTFITHGEKTFSYPRRISCLFLSYLWKTGRALWINLSVLLLQHTSLLSTN
jgi:hypothetical protein